jgi:hypothetical protein
VIDYRLSNLLYWVSMPSSAVSMVAESMSVE